MPASEVTSGFQSDRLREKVCKVDTSVCRLIPDMTIIIILSFPGFNGYISVNFNTLILSRCVHITDDDLSKVLSC